MAAVAVAVEGSPGRKPSRSRLSSSAVSDLPGRAPRPPGRWRPAFTAPDRTGTRHRVGAEFNGGPLQRLPEN